MAFDLGIVGFRVMLVEDDLLDPEGGGSENRQDHEPDNEVLVNLLLGRLLLDRRLRFRLLDRLQRRRHFPGLALLAAHGFSFSPISIRIRPVARARSNRACASSAKAAIRSARAAT
jgi:hypothetical protein